MKLLLDTHVFLWSLFGEGLSQTARDLFLDTNNTLFLSAASYWEICIKVSIGRLKLADNWIQAFDEEMRVNTIQWLPIAKEHSQRVLTLPMMHRDPFDRMLVAQAQYEKMTLLTVDANIRAYDVPTMW